MIRIAVDIGGSERGAAEVVSGARLALREGGFLVTLVGPRAMLEGDVPGEMDFVEAGFAIPMGEKVSRELLRRPESSLFQLVRLMREGRVDAIVSGGNTACFVALATTVLGTIPGVDRPGIAVFLPKTTGMTILIDAGANTAATPEHLESYGVMGSSLCQAMYQRERPAVGLVNVGHEEGKGTEMCRAAYGRLKANGAVRFVGNIEGHNLFDEKVDVAVTDGFTGNCILKALEGMAEDAARFLRDGLREGNLEPGEEVGRLLDNLRRRSDFSEHSGGFLMGVNGVCIIIHGRSGAEAHRSAILRARDAARHGLITRLKSVF